MSKYFEDSPLVCIINLPALDKGDSSSIQEPSPSKSSSTVGETASTNVTSAGGNSENLSSRTSTPPKLQQKEAMKLLEEYFPEAFSRKTLHSYYTCSGSCTEVSKQEQQNQKGKGDKFQHRWLFEETLAFSSETGMWWLVYIEGEGMYCLLCRVHNTKNRFNKDSKFNCEPSIRYKRSALFNAKAIGHPGGKKDLGHAQSTGHLGTYLLELERRKSPLAQQHKAVQEKADKVTFNAMLSAYWLAHEEIANVKLKSLLNLEQQLGLQEMSHWKNTSERCQREQRLLLGQLLKKTTLAQIQEAKWFSILVDEVTDCAVTEQLLIYIGYVDETGEPHFDFLEVKDCLATSDSANAETITRLIVEELKESGLQVEHACGFGSDGASVMTGAQNGVGARLQAVCPLLVRTHCINHRLALACGDANDQVKFITTVETTLKQLWKWLEYPKRCSAYIKVCESLRKIQVPDPTQKKSLAVKVKKACRTRWLSTGQSVSSVCTNLVALMQTLRKFKEYDATADGLLKRMNNIKFVGTLLILNEVLPHLNTLSKVFQKNKIHYSAIKPSLESIKRRITEVRSSCKPLHALKEALIGQYKDLELTLPSSQEELLANLCQSYTLALEENLDRRFTQATPVLEAFSIFNPTTLPAATDPEFMEYGVESVKILACQFQFSEEQMKTQWQNFKYLVLSWQPPQNVLQGGKESKLSPTEWILRKIVKEQALLKVSYSFLVDAAKICLTQPMSNAVVERGASAVKRVKTRLRNRLKNDMLSTCLHVSINGPEPKSEECQAILAEAAQVWRNTDKRNIPPLNLPRIGGSKHEDVRITETATVAIQTEAPGKYYR